MSTSLIEAQAAFNFPVAAPTVTGGNKAKTSRGRVVLRGTSANATSVEFQAGNGGFKATKGTAANWRTVVRLKKPRTVVKVRASEPGGSSRIARVVVRR